jgi:hypothetical protein
MALSPTPLAPGTVNSNALTDFNAAIALLNAAFPLAVGNIGNNAVETAKIKNANVTLAKIANIATARLLGRKTADAGIIEELTFAEVNNLLGAVRSSIRARLSGNQTLAAANTYYILALATQDLDVLGEFSTVTYRFTASETGIYLVNASILIEIVAALDRISLSISKNSGGVAGAGIIRNTTNAAPVASNQTVFISGIISLTAGDYIEIHVNNLSSAGDTVTANSPRTFLEITRIA